MVEIGGEAEDEVAEDGARRLVTNSRIGSGGSSGGGGCTKRAGDEGEGGSRGGGKGKRTGVGN